MARGLFFSIFPRKIVVSRAGFEGTARDKAALDA
jgi:hypothetical protein